MRSARPLLLLSLVLLPVTAFALPGYGGPSVNVIGIVQSVNLTPQQVSSGLGGNMVVLDAQTGEEVTMNLSTDRDNPTKIIPEGKTSRRTLAATDVQVGMHVRVRGRRIDSKTMTASLFIITNLETSPVLSFHGSIQDVGAAGLTVLLDNGQTKTFGLDNSTSVDVSYLGNGKDAFMILGKEAFIAVSATDSTLARIVRVRLSKGGILGPGVGF